jgi:hypothetical protein
VTVPLSLAAAEGTWCVVVVRVLLVSQGMGTAVASGARAVRTAALANTAAIARLRRYIATP